jgi:citrate synthase
VAAGQYLTATEAAAYLGVTRTTLYAYVSRGLVASEPAPGSSRRERRYPRRSLDDLKARRSPVNATMPVLESSISLIDGGRLWYRGLDACELSGTASYEEVACLLWTGSADGAGELFPRGTTRRRRRDARPLGDLLVACLVEERARHPVSLADADAATLQAAARTIGALFDAAGATGTGTLAERLARGWRTRRDSGVPLETDDLRAALVLCADHELNTSTFTARCVASTDAPIHNALLAALCALEGRRHGGAVGREVCDLLDDVERLGAEEACGRELARSGWVPGLRANPLYPDGDPRAVELLRRLDLPPTDPAAQAIAFAESIGGGPSLELALAALVRRARLPNDTAFALFALGRSAGWVAHALEAAAQRMLIRPRARYIGREPRG